MSTPSNFFTRTTKRVVFLSKQRDRPISAGQAVIANFYGQYSCLAVETDRLPYEAMKWKAASLNIQTVTVMPISRILETSYFLSTWTVPQAVSSIDRGKLCSLRRHVLEANLFLLCFILPIQLHHPRRTSNPDLKMVDEGLYVSLDWNLQSLRNLFLCSEEEDKTWFTIQQNGM